MRMPQSPPGPTSLRRSSFESQLKKPEVVLLSRGPGWITEEIGRRQRPDANIEMYAFCLACGIGAVPKPLQIMKGPDCRTRIRERAACLERVMQISRCRHDETYVWMQWIWSGRRIYVQRSVTASPGTVRAVHIVLVRRRREFGGRKLVV